MFVMPRRPTCNRQTTTHGDGKPMTAIDPAEIHAEFSRIRKRFEGSDLASIRTEKAMKVEAYISTLEEATAACTCGAGQRAFEINGADKLGEAMFHFTQHVRNRAEEKLNGWSEVFETAEARRAGS